MGTPTADEARPTATIVFSALPGLLAVVLGATYVAGAVAYIVALSDADLAVPDTLPLIPLEHVVSRGMGILASPITLVNFVTYVVVSFDKEGRGMNDPNRRRLSHRAFLIGFLAVQAVITVVLSWTLGLSYALALGTAVGVWLFVYDSPGWFADTPVRRGVGYLLVLATFFSAQAVYYAIVSPKPLPRVTLDLTAGKPVSGPLIVQTGGDWYVGTADDRYRVVLDGDVKSSSVKSRDRKNDESLLRVIF